MISILKLCFFVLNLFIQQSFFGGGEVSRFEKIQINLELKSF